MAVALMFVPRSPKPAAGPVAAALTLPRPRAASSPAPTEGCAEPRARCRAACSPSLFSHRPMPLLPLSPPAHGLLRGCKMDYSDPPRLLRRRAMPRTGKHSVPLGLVAGTPRYAARHQLPCPPAPVRHLSLEAPYSSFYYCCYYFGPYDSCCCYCYCNYRCCYYY